MTTNLENCEHLQSAETHPRGPEANTPRTSDSNGKSAGFIVYLTERELLEAYPRATREYPDAIVHFEHQDDDLWSLEVYRSEAAKRAYLRHFYYREKALDYLDPIMPGERPPDA